MTMSSYQVVCSVTRPPDPTSRCQIREFQEKAQSHHLDSVFQDLSLSVSHSQQGQGHGGSGPQGEEQCERADPASSGDPAQSPDDNLMLCAVVSKASACFSGADNFQSRVKLPFYWCDLCPFDTESKASLLQHMVSQHCFSCRFCPYMALSRAKVITHGLRQHPAQFAQFREQRLKACHLKRDQFQQHFNLQSEGQQPSRKRSRHRSSDSESNEVPVFFKHLRRSSDSTDNQPEEAEGLEAVHDGGGGGEGSSEESTDDLPLERESSPERNCGSSGLLSTSQQSLSLATHVMENVVSSSGMEPDMGIGTDHTLTSSKSGGGQPPEKGLSPQAAQATSSVPRAKETDESSAPTVRIKQEKDCDEAEFAQALGRAPAERHGHAGQAGTGDDELADCTLVDVKQEPVDDDDDEPALHRRHVGRVMSRAVNSPPLSSIKVENLQRQFEESFGVHPITSPRPTSSSEHCDVGPVCLVTEPSSGGSGVVPQRLVENFLIDTCPEGSSDRSSPSMLRHLLTRPIHPDTPPHLSPQPTWTDSAQGDSGAGGDAESESRGEHMESRDSDSASTSACVQDNFLLMSDKKHDDACASEEGLETKARSRPAQKLEDPEVKIKQEPEDSAEDYSTSLHLMSSLSAAGPGSSFLQTTSQHALSLAHKGPSSSSAGGHRGTGQSSTSEHTDRGLGSLPPPPPPLAASKPLSRDRASRKEREPSSPAAVAPGSAEKLKSFSNMSLRDLLTMDTSAGPCPPLRGQPAKTPPTPAAVAAAAAAVATAAAAVSRSHTQPYPLFPPQAEPAGRGNESGDVVWECGFCLFEDHSKAIVMAHRRLQHAFHMREAGMVDNGEEEEEACQDDWEAAKEQAWMDQPSTSSGYCSVSQMFSPTFPPPSTSAGALLQRRLLSAKGRVRAKARRDDDFHYLSDSSVDFGSDPEPDDLDDKTYEPPKCRGLANLPETLGSDDFDDDEEEVKKSKSKKMTGEKAGRRQRVVGKKSEKRDSNGSSSGGATATPKKGIFREKSVEDGETGSGGPELYRCAACKRPPLPLAQMKDHIRYAEDRRHLLVVRPALNPSSLLFVCPGAQCCSSAGEDSSRRSPPVFTEYQSFLVHVLQCQGHIFDVLRSAVQSMALTYSSRVPGGDWGGLSCPISNCRFVSLQAPKLQEHIDRHLGYLHGAQMLLFRTVCTVMAKMYGGVDGFDRFICYHCSSILMDLPRCLQHMRSDHQGQVRGVLVVTQKTEKKSQGIVVAIQCLKCSLRIPSLHLWFTHQCQSGPPPPALDDVSGSSSSEDYHYDPQPNLPPFQEWVWGRQSASFKDLATASASKDSACTSVAQKESDLASSSHAQLPLIRSILMSNPRSQQGRPVGKRSETVSKKRNNEEGEEEEEDVTAMVLCDACQQLMPEHQLLQHSCVREKTAIAVKKEKDWDGGTSNEGPAATPTITSAVTPVVTPVVTSVVTPAVTPAVNSVVTSAVTPAISASARASRGLYSQQCATPQPVDTNISHSKLLQALASHHHNNPPADAALPSKHFIAPSSISTTPNAQSQTAARHTTSIIRKSSASSTPVGSSSSSSSNSGCTSSAAWPQSASSTHPSLMSLLTNGDKASLSFKPWSSDPQSRQSTQQQSPFQSPPANALRDHLATFQLMHPLKSATATTSSITMSASSVQASPDSVFDSYKAAHSKFSKALRQKLCERGQQDLSSSSSSNPTSGSSRGQEEGSQVDGAEQSGKPPSASPCTLAVDEKGDQGSGKAQEPELTTSGASSSTCSSLMPGGTPQTTPQKEDGEDPSSQASTPKANQPLLMNFLRQQGDQVMQVIGNVLGHQEDLSQS